MFTMDISDHSVVNSEWNYEFAECKKDGGFDFLFPPLLNNQTFVTFFRNGKQCLKVPNFEFWSFRNSFASNDFEFAGFIKLRYSSVIQAWLLNHLKICTIEYLDTANNGVNLNVHLEIEDDEEFAIFLHYVLHDLTRNLNALSIMFQRWAASESAKAPNDTLYEAFTYLFKYGLTAEERDSFYKPTFMPGPYQMEMSEEEYSHGGYGDLFWPHLMNTIPDQVALAKATSNYRIRYEMIMRFIDQIICELEPSIQSTMQWDNIYCENLSDLLAT